MATVYLFRISQIVLLILQKSFFLFQVKNNIGFEFRFIRAQFA